MHELGCIIVLIIGIFVTALSLGVQEENKWQKFSQEHNCKLVAREDSIIIPIIEHNNSFNTIIIPEEETYTCDDGVTYTR